MGRAFCLVRAEPAYRRESFVAGLKAAGYLDHGACRDTPRPDDVLVIWNRYGGFDRQACVFEQFGARVIVAENGLLGRMWQGEPWYTLALDSPAGVGRWPGDHGSRWDSFGVKPCEWRKGGTEAIVIGQRGIGPSGVAMPHGWDLRAVDQLRRAGERVRLRPHPGERPASDLFTDLENAKYVVTWSSGAALRALLWGIPVIYGLNQWIGATAATPFDQVARRLPELPDSSSLARGDRNTMFARLGWTIWRIPEIEAGLPFQRLLALPSLGSRTTPDRT